MKKKIVENEADLQIRVGDFCVFLPHFSAVTQVCRYQSSRQLKKKL